VGSESFQADKRDGGRLALHNFTKHLITE